MEQSELLDKLHSLAQLDTDAVAVYDEALESVDDEEVRKSFERFQAEHRYHASWLVDTIERIGGSRPEMSVDLVGRMVDWVTSLRSRSGTHGALKAMQTAERYHNRRYSDAMTWDVDDPDVANMIRRFDEDERRHLSFVEERLGVTVSTGAGGSGNESR
jgi:rubrerythrin